MSLFVCFLSHPSDMYQMAHFVCFIFKIRLTGSCFRLHIGYFRLLVKHDPICILYCSHSSVWYLMTLFVCFIIIARIYLTSICTLYCSNPSKRYTMTLSVCFFSLINTNGTSNVWSYFKDFLWPTSARYIVIDLCLFRLN